MPLISVGFLHCSSMDKAAGKAYDQMSENATHCPNCASNFCRKHYFSYHDPTKAETVLRWAASIIIHEKNLSSYWGNLDPGDNQSLPNTHHWHREVRVSFRNNKDECEKCSKCNVSRSRKAVVRRTPSQIWNRWHGDGFLSIFL